ncbi:uncharacterized protein [Panulirus ornatus]|uniref:uncharacterized protein isoform X2 n=1 Tax=Panulirus ornatus TaxID=150431 RepID=UPI003A8B2133
MVSDKQKKVLGFLKSRTGRRDRDGSKNRSSREGTEDNRDVGVSRQIPERRESGRFPSAARLLRSLARSRDDDGGGARPRDASEPRLSRANPHYHSEGKGLKKKNNWTSERELNNSVSPTHKERSHSFCEKTNTKRRYSYHDNKMLREEARARLDRQDDSPSQVESSNPRSPSNHSPTPSIPTPTPTTPASPQSPSPENKSENIYENLPAHMSKDEIVVNGGDASVSHEAPEGSKTEAQTRPLERGERERRSVRKLTKDSGYETSPYSESDYANIDLYSEADATLDGEGDGDDVTLAPESELAFPSPTLDSTNLDPHSDPAHHADPVHNHTPGKISGESSRERRCSWQPQGSSASSGTPESASEASAAAPEGTSPSPSLSGSRASQGTVELSFPRNTGARSSRRSPLPRYPSAESLTSFAESLVSPGGASSSSSSLVPAKSTPLLHQDASQAQGFSAKRPSVSAALHASRSTPNLDDADDGSMVTKKSSMYSYLQGASASSHKGGMGGSGIVGGRYWDATMGADDTPDREDYAHHLRSSSYQLLHSRQLSALSSGSAGSFHSRQHSNTSNYSEPDDLSPRGDLSSGHSHHSHHHGMDRARFFSYDNLGPEPSTQKYHGSWNMSEPDLTLAPPPYSPPGPGYQQHQPPISPTLPASVGTPSSVKHSPTSNSSGRHPSSPPPPPVRDASSLKYIKYGPGHEKYPSWPVPAGNQVMSHGSSAHDANISGLPDPASQSPAPQGSHRSKSWTEQSEYPKEKAGGYARPYNKKSLNQSFQRQLKTVMERTEKIPKEVFHNSLREDMFSNSDYSFMDSYYKPTNPYYPLYDRDGRALDDKDYSIPSPPERDLGMGEANLGQVTAAQFEEIVRQFDEFGYTELIDATPLLDQLRRESVMWDGSSERDSGRGESESVADSARYSNGRESVTTVVTNSSSASSSETLKWHGSLSDISILSGHSRDHRSDHNIVHSSRVQAPQRHNSESVLYYGADARGKLLHGRLVHESRDHRDLRRSVRDTESGYPRPSREGKWSREVERNNEMNNLKKFPSYSYTQPLSQITEAPTAEMRETPRSPTRSPQSPTVDFSKPPSVAERIHELERQSRTNGPESGTRWPRDQSGSRERDSREPRDMRDLRDPRDHRDSRESREPLDPRDLQDPRRSRDDTSPQEARDLSDKVESRTPREHRESSEIRTHQRRGSRDSQRGDRDIRLDFSRIDRKGEGSNASMDGVRSPSTPGSSSRSHTQKDAEGRPFIHENFQNILNAFTEVDRVDRMDRSDRMSSNVSYSYLDPEKRRKVSDATLKSIQKQAVMSFYERHTGKSLSGASVSDLSSASSQSSLVSSQSAPETSQGKWTNVPHPSMNQSVRTDKSGRAGKGMARLGRVPESELDDQTHRPARRRSMSGRDSGSETGTDDLSRGGSQRSSLASDAASSRGEQPPALPQKQSQVHQETATRSSSTSSSHSISANEESRTTEEAESHKDDDNSRTSSSRGVLDGALASSENLVTNQIEPPRPPSLPPPAHDEPPPRPPERPPKKPTLRSLFHGPNSESASSSPAPHAGAATPSVTNSPHQVENTQDTEMRRIEESASELRNMSPARPYYYRKPPAPDPPKSPEATPAATASPVTAAATPNSPRAPRSPRAARLHASPTHAAHLVPPTSPASRSSTPDLPPPPPPVVTDGEVLFSDEPLPPPPTEVAPPPTDVPPLPPDSPPRERLMGTPPPLPRETLKSLSTPQTYHKDSYMAHRRDWKTGFEGRYRRTISPSASNRNLLYTREDTTNNNTANSNSSSASTTTTITATTTTTSPSPQQQEPERRSSTTSTTTVTTTTPTTPPAGILRTVASTSNLVQSNNSKNVSDNDDSVNNNGWMGHARTTSTTVNFTAEELRAFKARRANIHPQDLVSHASDKENSMRQLHPSQSSPALSSTALHSLASDGSTTSLASGGTGSSLGSGRSGSPASPSKLSPAHSWRTSLDSLHRPNPSTVSFAATHSPRTITRTTSLADPLHSSEEVVMSCSMSQEALHLPRTSSINESLSRITAISDSLSRSTSVADSLSRSTAITETPTSTHYRTNSVTEAPTYLSSPPVVSAAPQAPASPASLLLHDGPVTAHPATVTEEASVSVVSDSPKSPLTPKSPSSPKSPLSTKSLSPLTPLSSKSPLSPKVSLSPASPQSPITDKAPTFSSSTPTTTTPSMSTSSSFPITSPSMSPPTEPIDHSNIVVLGYGRTPYQEEIECDQLSKDYVPQFSMDMKLRALLAPGPEHKTAAHYMEGVFNLELRKDFISSTHAHHPDLSRLRSRKNTDPTAQPITNGESSNGLETSSDKSPLPADSAYFTTSESKAKMLTRLRGSNNNLHDGITPLTDQQQLHKKKEELVASIGRKLEILRAEQEAIKEEMRLNHELGVEVTSRVEAKARLAEAEKYKLHVEEIDKITSLLLGLSGRLARAENALLMMVDDADPEEKRILESKRDKLSEQLEEAKKLKENIDRRAVQVSKVLNQYLTEDQYADYDHFIKMKAKLIMDAREIDDKIKLGEEQQQALRETMTKKQ